MAKPASGQYIGDLTVPLATLTMGGSIAMSVRGAHEEIPCKHAALEVTLMKLNVLPVLGYFILKPLVGAEDRSTWILLMLEFAAPPGLAIAVFAQQHGASGWEGLTFEERLGLLVDREMTQRENRHLAQRLKAARLRQNALAEEIDFRHRRGLDRALMLSLLGGHWLRAHDNCIIVPPQSECPIWEVGYIKAATSHLTPKVNRTHPPPSLSDSGPKFSVEVCLP